MTGEHMITIIVAATSTIGVIVAAWFTKQSSQKNARLEVTKSPYEALSARISVLEPQVGELRNDIEELQDERAELRQEIASMRLEQLSDRSLLREMFDYFERNFPDRNFPFRRPSWMDRSGGS